MCGGVRWALGPVWRENRAHAKLKREMRAKNGRDGSSGFKAEILLFRISNFGPHSCLGQIACRDLEFLAPQRTAVPVRARTAHTPYRFFFSAHVDSSPSSTKRPVSAARSSPFTTSNMENAAAMGPAAEQAATADSASATYASDGASGVAATEAAPAPAQATSKPAKAKRGDGGGFHKGCFDYVKSMGPSTPDLVKSVVCCTVMLASGKKVTKFADAQQFCRNKSAALKAVQEFDKAGVDEKLIKEADKLYGGAHDDMEAIVKKSKVVAEMAQWNKSALGK